MNTGMIKLWAWAVAALLTLGLAWYVFDFLRHREEMSRTPDPAAAKAVFDAVEPPKLKSDDLLSYDTASRLVARLDWTGAPKPVEKPPEPPKQPEKQVVPVSRLIIVTSVLQDVGDPASSMVTVRYRPDAGVTNPAIATYSTLKEGDHLVAPVDYVQVRSITADFVEFAFDDTAREAEKVGITEFDAKSKIVVVGPDGVILQPVAVTIPTAKETYRPGRTSQLGSNRFRLGQEDVQEFGERYPEILGREVTTARHQDPRTGKYDGIEIKSVQPGSIAARHGAQEGDVIKSINGHAVNSTQEAINYVKVNANNYTTWEIVVENKGKTRTVTYESSGGGN